MHAFVIHERPDDHPSKVVVRQWRFDLADGTFDTGTLAVADDVADARLCLPPGAKQLRALRPTFDDATVLEVWTT